MNKFAYSVLRGASAGAVLLGASLIAPSIAFAKTPPAPRAAPPAATTQVDELVVVGSRIRRDNFTTTAPISNRPQFQDSGSSSVTGGADWICAKPGHWLFADQHGAATRARFALRHADAAERGSMNSPCVMIRSLARRGSLSMQGKRRRGRICLQAGLA